MLLYQVTPLNGHRKHRLASGYHSSEWKARDLPSGIYPCRLVARDYVETKFKISMELS